MVLPTPQHMCFSISALFLLMQDEATGQEKPGNKGISLSQDQWNALCAALPQLGLALQHGDTKCALPLGALRRAYVSKFG